MGLIRTCLERLSRRMAFWRRLPEPFSFVRVLVTPDASLSHFRPGANWCDPELIAVVSRFVKPGDVVWDVGANVGVFGAAAAARSGPAGRVLCVEPDLALVRLIRKTSGRLPAACAKLETLAAAVADAAGIAEFHIAERGRASNGLAKFGDRSQTGGVRERQLVPVVSLDDLLKVSAAPALLKIDVEGAEAVIFDGARRVLDEARPIIYVEVGEQNAEKVTRQLHAASYDLFDPKKPLDGQAQLPACIWNTLAIPRKPDEVK